MIKPADRKSLKKLGEHIALIRQQKKMSLRDVSYACNIDNSKISKIEKGQINITFTTMLQLAEALEVSLPELLNYR